MKKIAINECFGGFDLSNKGWKLYIEKKYPNASVEVSVPECISKEEYLVEDLVNMGFAIYEVDGRSLYAFDLDRTDPVLIEVIETLKEEANADHSKLKVVEIPDDVDYEITDYDGVEKIEESHRVWC